MAVGRKAAPLQDLPSQTKIADPKRFDCSQRRDADWDRIKFYGRVINKIVWEYLEPTDRTTLPRSYIHLIRVATSPKWQRHGAGTMLCKWGIDVAQKHRLQIGLLATPSGWALYSQLGWKELTRAVVRMPEEKESVSMTVMKWYPKEDSLFAQTLGGVYRLGEALGLTLCRKKIIGL